MESIASSVAGSLVGGLFGNEGGGSQSQQTRQPWGPVIPYLTGGTDENGNPITGVLPESARVYDMSQWTPEMQQAYLTQVLRLNNTTNDPYYNDIIGGAKAIMNGEYDPLVSRVGAIRGANEINPGQVSPQMVDPTAARAAMGDLDPTDQMYSLLSGTVSNPYLQNQADSIVNQLTRNTLENIMPSITSGAVANGYGSSRQGIAEGLAASRLNQDVSQALSQLYGGAYENAQNRALSTANGLNSQAYGLAEGNANRDLSGQQFNTQLDYNAQAQNAQNDLQSQMFNANLGLSNNSQAIANSGAQIGNRINGMNLMGNGQNLYNGQYNNLMNTLAYPNNYAWNNLNNYANIANAVAGQGGVTNTNGQQNNSTLSNMFGGAAMGRSIYDYYRPKPYPTGDDYWISNNTNTFSGDWTGGWL